MRHRYAEIAVGIEKIARTFLGMLAYLYILSTLMLIFSSLVLVSSYALYAYVDRRAEGGMGTMGYSYILIYILLPGYIYYIISYGGISKYLCYRN